MEGLSRATPLLMILEDAHWADPTSVEVFGRTRYSGKKAESSGSSVLPQYRSRDDTILFCSIFNTAV